MKKLFVSALAMLAVALGFTACSSDDELVNETPAQGQKVTVIASTEKPGQRTALQQDGDVYKVVWLADDKIKLIDASSNFAEFTLKNEYANQSTGEFTGNAPDPGTYTAYYPSTYDGTWPAVQTYEANNIPLGVPMKATDVNVEAGNVSPISFKNEGGILRLNLEGTAKVTSITISANNLTNPITLDCSKETDGYVPLNSDGVPFHIAVKEADYSGLKIEITDNTGAVCTRTATTDITVQRSMITDITLTASSFEHTYVELAGTKWATVNVGAVAGITPKGTPHATYGYLYTQANAVSAAASWGSNWVLPTKAQWEALKDNCTWNWKDSYSFGGKTMNGYLVTDGNNGNSIFLPAAGANYGSTQLQGERGNYWSADQSEYGYWGLTFMYYGYNSMSIDNLDPSDGMAVRLVSQ